MRARLNALFKETLVSLYGSRAAGVDPAIQSTARAEYGDYQANFAMRLSKIVHKKPLDIAHEVIAQLHHHPHFSALHPSGPGFINIFLANDFLTACLHTLAHDERLGVSQSQTPQKVVLDYANANVAKEMHVGHIRSIVIGDAIVRILDFLGHSVVRQSHLGDWGTQFGMLIEYLLESGAEQIPHSVSELDPLYKKSKERFDADPQFADKARARVVALQSGDDATLAIWKKLVKESLLYFQQIYQKLDVLVTEEDARGESFYNPMLSSVVNELKQNKMAETNEGAIVLFMDEFKGPNDKPLPFIIQKKDGGYLYATTDLAAAKFRIENLHATRLIYLTDARQKQHFAMLFAALRKAGWANENVRLEHIPFGAILGKDNKPFKTRSGESIKLISLLEEAENRALAIAKEKNPDLPLATLLSIAHDIGIGALKYADLRADKIKDYVFDWEKLLSFEGNTAPYLQNAYVRICAIFRKGNVNLEQVRNAALVLPTEIEHRLAINILDFPDVIHAAAEYLSLHSICDYLYDLSAAFHRFYENCPILNTDDPSLRNSRLLLADLCARVINLGLNLLGIKTLEKM